MADLSYVVEVTGSEQLGKLATGIEQVTAALNSGKGNAEKLAAFKAELSGFGSATAGIQDIGKQFDSLKESFGRSISGLGVILKTQGALLNAQMNNLGAELSSALTKPMERAPAGIKAAGDRLAKAAAEAQKQVAIAMNNASGDVQKYNANTGISGAVSPSRMILAANMMNMPSKADFEAASALAVKNAAELAAKAYAMVKVATFSPAGMYSNINTGKVVGAYDVQASSLKTLTAQQARASTESGKLGTAFKQLTVDGGDAHAMARGLASGFGLLWLTWGNMLPLFAGAAVSNGFMQIAKQGMEAAHSLEIIAALGVPTSNSIGQTAKEISLLNSSIIELGRTGIYAPTELAKGMEILSLAGLSVSDTYKALPTVLALAVAGTTTVANSADVLVSMTTAFGTGAEGFREAADIIVRAAADSKASVESIGAAMKLASVAGEQYGASMTDVGTLISLLANLGIQGSAAGTAVRNMFVDMSERTPKVAKLMKQFGLEFRDATTGDMKPLLANITQLDTALAKLDNISGKNLLQNIFSERGGKTAIAALVQYRQAITNADGTTQEWSATNNKLTQSLAAVENSAGDAAIAAAKMEQSTTNAFKGASASLQTSMYEAYMQVEPQLYQIAISLKEAFSSPAAVYAIKSLMELLTKLAVVLVEHIGLITSVAAAFGAWKISQLTIKGMSDAFEYLSVSLYRMVAPATASTVAVSAVGTAAAATGAASTTAAAGVGIFANSLATLGRFLGPIGLAITALSVGYSIYSYLMGESNNKKDAAALKGDEVIKSLKAEAERLSTLNNLRAQGLSTLEAENELKERSLRLDAASGWTKQSADAKAELAKANQRLDLVSSNDSGGLNARGVGVSALDVAARSKAASEVLKAANEVARLELASQAAQDNVSTWAANVKSLAKADAAYRKAEYLKKQQDIKAATEAIYGKGTGTYSVLDKSNKTKKTHYVVDTKELETIKKDIDSKLAIQKSGFDLAKAEQDSQHKNLIISDAQYFVASLAATAKFESESLAILQNSTDEYIQEYQKKYAAIAAARDKPGISKDEYKIQSDKGEKVINDMVVFIGSTTAKIEKIQDDAALRVLQTANDAAGRVNKLVKAEKDYWDKTDMDKSKAAALKEIDKQYQYMNTSIFSMAEGEKASAIAILESKAASADRNRTLQDQLRLQEDIVTELEKMVIDPATDTAAVSAATKELAVARASVSKLKNLAGDSIRRGSEEGATAGAEALNKVFQDKKDKFVTSIGDAITTGIFDGAEAGQKKLRDMLVAALREPINTYVNVVVNSLTGAALEAIGISSKSSGGSGSTGFSPLSPTSFGDAFGAFSTSSFGQSLGLSKSVEAMGPAVEAMGPILEGSLDAALSSGIAPTMNAMTDTAASLAKGADMLGAVMSYASAFDSASQGKWGQAIGQGLGQYIGGPIGSLIGGEIGKAVDEAFGGEKRSGGTYGLGEAYDLRTNTYNTLGKTATFMEGPSGGKLSETENLINTTALSVGKLLELVGSSSKLIGFQAGSETSDSGRGGVYSGGTLTGGVRFGETGAGSNYDGGKYEDTSSKNGSATEIAKNFGDDMLQVTIQALQAASDVPKTISDMLNGIDAESLGTVEATALLDSISKLATDARTLMEATGASVFDNLKGMSFDLAATLIAASGDVSGLVANLNTYYDKFYTGPEKTANATANLNKAFAAMNIVMPEIDENTRAWYRSEVERLGAMDLNIEANAKAYTSVLSLSGAVDALAPALAGAAAAVSKTLSSLSDARFGLENNLLKLQGKSDEADARIRQADFDKLTEGITDAASLTKIAASYAQNMGLEKLIKNLEEQKGLQEQLNAITDTAAQALTRQRNALDETNRGLFDQVQAATKAKEATQRLSESWAELAAMIPNTLAKYRTPEQNRDAQYASIGKGLQDYGFVSADVGIDSIIAQLKAANKDTILAISTLMFDGLAETSVDAAKALLGFVDTLADIKDNEASTALTALNKTLDDAKTAATAAMEAEKAISDQRKTLVEQLFQLTATEAEKSAAAAAKARAEVDPSNYDVYDQIVEKTAELKTASDAAATSVSALADQMTRFGGGVDIGIDLNAYNQGRFTGAVDAINTRLEAYSTTLDGLDDLIYTLVSAGALPSYDGATESEKLANLTAQYAGNADQIKSQALIGGMTVISNFLDQFTEAADTLETKIEASGSTLGNNLGVIKLAAYFTGFASDFGTLIDSIKSIGGVSINADTISTIPNVATLASLGLDVNGLLVGSTIDIAEAFNAGLTTVGTALTDNMMSGISESITNNSAFSDLLGPDLAKLSAIIGSVGKDDVQGYNNSFLLLSNSLIKGELTTEQFRAALDLTTDTFKNGAEAAGTSAETIQQAYDRLRNPTKTNDNIAQEWISLEDRLYAATDSTAEAAARARAAIDPFNIALYDTVIAAEKAKDVAAELAGLNTQLLTAQGDTIALRNEERAKLDASNRALYDRINYLNDEKAVTAALQTVAQQYSSFVDNVTSTKSAVDSASEGITDGYLSAVDAVAAAQEQVNNVTQQAGEALLGFAASIREFVDGLDQTEAGGLNKSGQYAAATSDYTIALAQARAGDADAMGKVAGLAGSMLGLGKDTVTSAEDYRMLVAQTKGALNGLASDTETANSFAAAVDPMLAAQENLAKAQAELELWNKAISESGASTSKSVADYAADWRVANTSYQTALKDMLTADKLVAGLDMTLSTPIKDLAAAVAALAAATTLRDSTGLGVDGVAGAAAGGSIPGGPMTSSQIDSYNSTLYTGISQSSIAADHAKGEKFSSDISAIDSAGAAAYQAAIAAGGLGVDALAARDAAVTQASVTYGYSPDMFEKRTNAIFNDTSVGAYDKFLAETLGYSSDTYDLNKRLGIPGFASGGYHSGGMRLVGENGPELEVTGPSQIYNAADTANMLRGGGANNAEVVAELRALAARLEAIERNTSATAGHTAKSARQSERVMPGGDAITVRVIT